MDEPFGPLVAEWNTTPGRNTRLTHLCGVLGLRKGATGDLRYQLFHRTASAIFEAERYCARHAMMLVHSFSGTDASLDDFLRFAAAIGLPGAGKNEVSEARAIRGVELRLAWVGDRPSKS